MDETGQRYEVPANRTVENMVAAAKHIRGAVQRKIDEDTKRGMNTPARDIISLIEMIHATYETMLPN